MNPKYASLNGYIDDEGKFSSFPGKRQKRKVALMLEFLSEKFESDKKYSEKEVNEILNQHHSFNDPATLRRLMLGMGLLDRTTDGRAYWLIQQEQIGSS